MKNALILILLACTVVLGGLTMVQSRKAGQARLQTAELRSEIEQKDQKIEELQTSQRRAEEQQRDLIRASDELAAQVRTLRQPETKPAVATTPAQETNTASEKGKGGGFGKMIANMMNDPEMKKFVRDQQRAMLDPLYGPLIKQMGLTPEEAEKFKDLLSDNMMKGAEKATSMFGNLSETNHVELVSTLNADQKNFEEQVQAFLGEGRFAQYKQYQESVGERTQLNMFKQQNAGSDHPISEAQMDQLLAFMVEEKKAAANNGLPGLAAPGDNAANFQAMISSDQSDKLLQSQEAINQRVYERARTILSPDQMQDFSKFQANQLSMMRMGMNMARKMFSSDKPAGNP